MTQVGRGMMGSLQSWQEQLRAPRCLLRSLSWRSQWAGLGSFGKLLPMRTRLGSS